MNTSLFHKHLPAPFARQELAQAQAHSRAGWGQLGNSSHPNPPMICKALSVHGKALKLNEMVGGAVTKELSWECHQFRLHSKPGHFVWGTSLRSCFTVLPGRDCCTSLLPSQRSLQIRCVHKERFPTLGHRTVGIFSDSEQFLWPLPAFCTN